MATSSTAQFGQIVNEVLDAIGEPQIGSANFTNAVRTQRMVKQLVIRGIEDIQNGLPDEQWQETKELVVLPRFKTGTVTDIAADLVTFQDVDFDTEFNAGIEHPYTDEHCMFKLDGDNQWYWVKGTGTNGGEGANNLLRLYTKHVKYPASDPFSSTDGQGYQIVQIRYPLPSNARDIQDFVRFFQQADLRPMGINNLLREMRLRTGDSITTGGEPRYFAIGYDVTGHGTAPTVSTTDGPLVYLYPFLIDHKVFMLVYQRDAILPDISSSAFTQVLDIPSDMESMLLYNVITRAKMDIRNNFQEGGIYRGFAEEQKRKLAEKSMTQSAFSPVQPQMEYYRGHFRRGRRGWGTRIIVEE